MSLGLCPSSFAYGWFPRIRNVIDIHGMHKRCVWQRQSDEALTAKILFIEHERCRPSTYWYVRPSEDMLAALVSNPECQTCSTFSGHSSRQSMFSAGPRLGTRKDVELLMITIMSDNQDDVMR
jgi:hypothetical protein